MKHPEHQPARTDQELIDALNRGDPQAFDALYFRYRDWVLRLAWRYTLNQEDALDVLQDTFAYLARKFPGFQLSAAMTTFLYPVVRNLSLALRRKHTPATGTEEVFDTVPAPTTASAPAHRELAEALAGLPAGQRQVVLMRFVDDLSLEEISLALGVPVGTIKSRLHIALEALRRDPRTKTYFVR